MPFTFGHSRAVAGLASAAGGCMGLPEDDVRAIRWAGFVHDIGELAVPVSTWLKAARFSPREADAAMPRTCIPIDGERALAALGGDGQPLAALVLRHHERLDGSGYHRYAKAPDLSPAAGSLAAAEAIHEVVGRLSSSTTKYQSGESVKLDTQSGRGVPAGRRLRSPPVVR